MPDGFLDHQTKILGKKIRDRPVPYFFAQYFLSGDLSGRNNIPYFRACSIACTTFGLSGSSLLPKRATTFPERSTRNLLKFHEMEPLNSGFVSLPVRNLYSG